MDVFAITLRSRWYPDTDWAAVTLSAKEPGRVQFTRFDDEGPRGDTQHDTILEALREGMKWHGMVLSTLEPADHLAALVAVRDALQEEADRRELVEQCFASMQPPAITTSDADLLRDIIGAYDSLAMALDPDTDEEAAALHDLADRGLCEHTPEGFIPTDAGRAALAAAS